MRFKREKSGFKRNLSHFIRMTFTKIHCIKINHILTQISYDTLYEAHLKDNRLQGRYENENEGEEKKCVRFKREKWFQKNHHFFRVTFTKIHCIKINHILTQTSYYTLYEAHLKDKRLQGRCENEKGEEKMCEIKGTKWF